MNKPAKIVLGIFTLLPFLIILSTVSFGIYQIVEIYTSEEPFMPLLYLSYLGYVIPFLFFYSLFYLGLGIFYIVNIIQSNYFDTEKKILWTVVIIALNGFSMPAYWYFHIWKDHERQQTDLNPALEVTHESGAQPEKF